MLNPIFEQCLKKWLFRLCCMQRLTVNFDIQLPSKVKFTFALSCWTKCIWKHNLRKHSNISYLTNTCAFTHSGVLGALNATCTFFTSWVTMVTHITLVTVLACKTFLTEAGAWVLKHAQLIYFILFCLLDNLCKRFTL